MRSRDARPPRGDTHQVHIVAISHSATLHYAIHRLFTLTIPAGLSATKQEQAAFFKELETIHQQALGELRIRATSHVGSVMMIYGDDRVPLTDPLSFLDQLMTAFGLRGDTLPHARNLRRHLSRVVCSPPLDHSTPDQASATIAYCDPRDLRISADSLRIVPLGQFIVGLSIPDRCVAIDVVPAGMKRKDDELREHLAVGVGQARRGEYVE